MRGNSFGALHKNNGITKQEPSVIYKVNSFDDDHTELYIKNYMLSVHPLLVRKGLLVL